MTPTLENKGFLYTFSKRTFGQETDLNNSIDKSKHEIIQVLMADDHPYLVHGVEADLNKDPKIKIVGSAGGYEDLLIKNEELKPDVILLDLKMPDKDRYDLQQFMDELKRVNDKCKIIIFSNETGWARIHRCLEIGGSGYIEKAISVGRLAEFIHTVHDDDELVIFTAEQLPRLSFSPRQLEILHQITDGKENDEIAGVLGIEVKTVQSYVNEIKAKLAHAFGIHPIRPRTLMILASKLGFGRKIN